MHPTTTPFTALRTALAPQGGENARPHFRACDALLALLFQQLDRLFASLERLFADWQAGTLPPPPPPRAPGAMLRAARHSPPGRLTRHLPRPIAARLPVAAPCAHAPASETRSVSAQPPRAAQAQPLRRRIAQPRTLFRHHGPDPPRPRLPSYFSRPPKAASPHAYIITIS